MNRVTPIVFLGLLAAAYSAGELNSTLLNQLTGKMTQVTIPQLKNCIALVNDKDGKIIGFGAVLQYGELILHEKYRYEAQQYGVTFLWTDTLKLKAFECGVYQSGTVMRMDSRFAQDETTAFKNIPYTTLVPKRTEEGVATKLMSIDIVTNEGKVAKKSLKLKKVTIVSGWEGVDFRTTKDEPNEFENIGDILFCGASAIGLLIQMPDSGGITTYQKLSIVRENMRGLPGGAKSKRKAAKAAEAAETSEVAEDAKDE